MKILALFTAVLLTGLAWNQQAAAQLNEKFSDMTGEVEMVRSMMGVERRAVVTDNMMLTDQEAAAFWPLYDEFRGEIKKVNDKLVKVLSDYGAQRDTLTDAQAKKLIADSFAYEQDLLKVRNKYVARFGKVMPMTKVARFYQIDNKLDVFIRLALALNVPLTN